MCHDILGYYYEGVTLPGVWEEESSWEDAIVPS